MGNRPGIQAIPSHSRTADTLLPFDRLLRPSHLPLQPPVVLGQSCRWLVRVRASGNSLATAMVTCSAVQSVPLAAGPVSSASTGSTGRFPCSHGKSLPGSSPSANFRKALHAWCAAICELRSIAGPPLSLWPSGGAIHRMRVRVDLSKKRFSLAASRSRVRISHSQMTRTRRPILRSFFLLSASRGRVAREFCGPEILAGRRLCGFRASLC